MNEENNWNNRLLLDDEQPEENSVPFGYLQEVGLPIHTAIITTTDTDTFTDNVTF